LKWLQIFDEICFGKEIINERQEPQMRNLTKRRRKSKRLDEAEAGAGTGQI